MPRRCRADGGSCGSNQTGLGDGDGHGYGDGATGTNGAIETAAANAGVTVLAAKPPEPEPRPPAPYQWAMLIARIYEVFPLVCLHCGGQMRIIAPTVSKILDHIGEDSRPPRITPARGPPLWDEFDVALAAREDAGAEAHQEWDPSAQSAPEYQVDQRIDW